MKEGTEGNKGRHETGGRNEGRDDGGRGMER